MSTTWYNVIELCTSRTKCICGFVILRTHWSFVYTSKDIQIPSKHNKIYYTLPLLDYMFQLLRVIIRPSSELIQNYLIRSALWDPIALTIVGAIVLWVRICYYSVYGYLCYYITI